MLNHDSVVKLRDRDGNVQTCHQFDERQVLAIHAALAAGRPLLVRGEPGTGKSQMARAAATALGRAFVYAAVDARTEPRDLLWSVDLVARLAEAQIVGHLPGITEAALQERLALDHFVRPGPVWWAFDWEGASKVGGRALAASTDHERPEAWHPDSGCVVLVDEIDKADPTVPNALLDAFGHGRFQAPSGAVVGRTGKVEPLVVITTNEERTLPDAFVRRCLVLTLAFPKRQTLLALGELHQPKLDAEVRETAADLLLADRTRSELGPYRPGLAEYLDLLRVLAGPLPEGFATPADLLKAVADFALKKNRSEPSR